MNLDRKTYDDTLTPLSKALLAFAGLLIGLILVRIFVMPFSAQDEAMLPSIQPGERMYLLKHFSPKVGEIVLIESPVERGKVLLSRIIAHEGDSVEIQNKNILINNERAAFSWKTLSKDQRIFPMSFSYRDNYPIIKLKRGQFFVLGDNFDSSMDSRFFGPITGKQIVGKLLYKF